MAKIIKWIALTIIAVFFVPSDAGTDWCKIKCLNRGFKDPRHVFCKFKNSGLSPVCKKNVLPNGGKLTKNEEKRILNLHNALRRKVAKGLEKQGKPGPQPRAKHIPDLVWDDRLASIAQRWANQCPEVKQDGHSCSDFETVYVGQNIAERGTTGNINTIKVEDLVMKWYDEVKFYPRNKVSKFSKVNGVGGAIGHYTQLVWAKTTRIGCAGIKYKRKKNSHTFNFFYLVCNYGPAGNVKNQPIYEIK